MCFRRRLCVLRIFNVNCRFQMFAIPSSYMYVKPCTQCSRHHLNSYYTTLYFYIVPIVYYIISIPQIGLQNYVCSIVVDVWLIPCSPNMGMCMVVIDSILLQGCSQEAAVPWTFYLERSSLFFFFVPLPALVVCM